MTDAKGASGNTRSCIVNRVYYRQLGLLGGGIHKAAIGYVRKDKRTIKSELHRPVSAPRPSRKQLFKYSVTVRI
jgi:hypothetical protein